VGVGAVVVGVVLGTQAQDLQKQSDAICPTSSCGDAHALALNHDAKTDALYADVGFVVGGVAIAGAAAMWFLGAPKVHGESVSLAPVVDGREIGIALGGHF